MDLNTLLNDPKYWPYVFGAFGSALFTGLQIADNASRNIQTTWRTPAITIPGGAAVLIGSKYLFDKGKELSEPTQKKIDDIFSRVPAEPFVQPLLNHIERK